MMKYLILILFFLACFCQTPGSNDWAFRQLLGLCILSLVISCLLSKKFHISVGISFLVTALYGLIQLGVPQFGSEVSTSISALLFFSCISIGLDDSYFDWIMPVLGLVAIGDSVIMIAQGLKHFGEWQCNMKAWWVLSNGALDASFLALMIPTVLAWPITLIPILAAIILTKCNTAVIVIILMSLAYLLARKEWKMLGIFILADSISGFYLAKYFGTKFMDDSGRLNNWKLMMGYWKDHINHWLGAGPGTYWAYSQWLQAHKVGDLVFPWMHNDWLQILFEQGIIGILAVGFLFFTMLRKSFDRPALFAMILGYGFIACTLYPLHLFMFQLLGVVLIQKTFRDKPIEIRPVNLDVICTYQGCPINEKL